MNRKRWRLLILLSTVIIFLCGCSFNETSSGKGIPKFQISNHSTKKIQLLKESMFCRKYCSKHYVVYLDDTPTNSNHVILSWKGMIPSPAVVIVKNIETGKAYPVSLKTSEASLNLGESKKDNVFQIHFEWGSGKFKDQVTRVIKIEK